jgi:hypothetical protein
MVNAHKIYDVPHGADDGSRFDIAYGSFPETDPDDATACRDALDVPV